MGKIGDGSDENLGTVLMFQSPLNCLFSENLRLKLEEPLGSYLVSTNTFTISDNVDLSDHPDFASTGGIMRVFVDRIPTAVSVTLSPDESFTSGPITLNDNQSWHIDRHYVSVNFYNDVLSSSSRPCSNQLGKYSK